MNSYRRRRIVISVGRTAAALAATAAPSVFVTVACGAHSADSGGLAGSVACDAARTAYVDGRYTAIGWYGSLPSSITVTLSILDDVIAAVEVAPRATDPTSLDFQRRFAAAVPQVVVGRRIDEVKVDRLAGSSGTPAGFNDALRQIRAQARRSPEARP